MKDHEVLAVLDKEKQMPEPSNKLFLTDPRATPGHGVRLQPWLQTGAGHVLGSEDVQEIRTSRLSPPPRRGRTCGCGGQAQSDRESTAFES